MTRDTFQDALQELELQAARLRRDEAAERLVIAKEIRQREDFISKSIRLAIAESVDLTKLPKFS